MFCFVLFFKGSGRESGKEEERKLFVKSTDLIVVAGTRAAICTTRSLYLRRSFHRTSGIAEGGGDWDRWVGSMVVVVMMLEMVTMLLKTT